MPAKNIKEYNRQYYVSRAEVRREQVKARQRAIKKEIQDYKLSRGCELCGYKKSAVALTFHHKAKDKEHNIARMVTQGRALKSIYKEIDKCMCLCSNCHHEIHGEEYDSIPG